MASKSDWYLNFILLVSLLFGYAASDNLVRPGAFSSFSAKLISFPLLIPL